MYTLQKKHIGFLLGAMLAFLLITPALLGFAHNAQAAGALSADQFFGKDSTGADISGKDFAGNAGLSSGNLITTIQSIIRIALGFLGVVAVVIILMGGFMWMTAGGNDEKLKKAKARIYQGIIGLVIILSAYAIASFVITSIVNATK